jgi:hypothetical protein
MGFDETTHMDFGTMNAPRFSDKNSSYYNILKIIFDLIVTLNSIDVMYFLYPSALVIMK